LELKGFEESRQFSLGIEEAEIEKRRNVALDSVLSIELHHSTGCYS
jgi:hypothetical protein